MFFYTPGGAFNKRPDNPTGLYDAKILKRCHVGSCGYNEVGAGARTYLLHTLQIIRKGDAVEVYYNNGAGNRVRYFPGTLRTLFGGLVRDFELDGQTSE